MSLVNPHGPEKRLIPLKLEGNDLKLEQQKAETLTSISISSREFGDIIMLGIGGFTPLTGFVGYDDWYSICKNMTLKNGLFWPIPIALSCSKDEADSIEVKQEVALRYGKNQSIVAVLTVSEKYRVDKDFECNSVFKTNDSNHPGVKKVMEQGEVNLAGSLKVLSEGHFPEKFKDIYIHPKQSRHIFNKKGWKKVAAFQTRNPMHRSHEFLVASALDTCDGAMIHQLLGNLKPGDLPANIRSKAIDQLIGPYLPSDRVIQAGYPLDMRYAGPREALLHAVFRQNFGCSHLIIGRDHAGVGEYYGPFDSQDIFDQIPPDALEIKPLKFDWSAFCYKCEKMVFLKECPHDREDQLVISGTMLRKMLSDNDPIPAEFSRPEVVKILTEYYSTLKDRPEIQIHKYAHGNQTKL